MYDINMKCHETFDVRMTGTLIKGDPGDDYVITEKDYDEIAKKTKAEYGGELDLIADKAKDAEQKAEGYATEAKNAKASADADAESARVNANSASTSATLASNAVAEARSVANSAKMYSDSASASMRSASASADEARSSADQAHASAAEAKVDYTELSEEVTAHLEKINKLSDEQKATERSLSALWDLNRDISWRFEEDNASGDKVIPSGAKEASLIEVGGMSRKGLNILNIPNTSKTLGSALVIISDNKISIHGRNNSDYGIVGSLDVDIPAGTYYTSTSFNVPTNNNVTFYARRADDSYIGAFTFNKATTFSEDVKKIRIVIQSEDVYDINDLQVCIKKGTDAGFEPYTDSLIDAKVDEVEVMDKTIEIPQRIRDLCPDYGIGINDSCYNYIDFENKKYVQRVGSVDLGSKGYARTTWGTNTVFTPTSDIDTKSVTGSIIPNLLSSEYDVLSASAMYANKTDHSICVNPYDARVYMRIVNDDYTDVSSFKKAMNGVILYYELATPIEVDLSSVWDDTLSDIITVESGGSIRFNYPQKESYSVDVPNKVQYLVALNEVTA